MNVTLHHAHVDLDRCGAVHLRDAAGVRLLCVSGAVWITQHLDVRDVVLHQGEAFDIDRGGLTVVSATEPSHVVLVDTRHAA